MIIYCCKTCGNQICSRTALYGDGQCKKCANLGKNNPMFGKKGLCGKNNPSWINGKPKCIGCGKKLTGYRSKYCAICFPKSRKNKPRSGRLRFGKLAPSYKDGRTLKQNRCIDCNKEIHWRAKRCVDCFGISQSGKNNPNYIHGQGYKRYPLSFNNRLKIKIKIRDNFKCQRCNLSENEHIKKFNEVLHIHHIDYNRKNCKESNLITTCKMCNLKANGNNELDRDYWYAYYTYLMEDK